jgi:hypothetical protein
MLGWKSRGNGAEQFTRALDQITTLPSTPELRRKEIELQVALITPLIHVKGFTATETKAAAERAHRLIESAESRGEGSEPLLLFSVLYGVWVSNALAANFTACCDLATQFLALAERHNSTAPLLMAHRVMGQSLMFTGDFGKARTHFDKGIALYDPAEHGPLSTRLWARCAGRDAEFQVLGIMVPWLSRRRAEGLG